LHALSNIASNKRDAPLGIYLNDREQIQRCLGCLEDILSRKDRFPLQKFSITWIFADDNGMFVKG